MLKFIDKLLDKRDMKKKDKALADYPWRYVDRHGNHWFNTCYRKSYESLRKWC